MEAEPLGDELTQAIENKDISVTGDAKELAKNLQDKFGWDISEARKIWCFGPDDTGANCFIDKTTGV